MMPADNIQTMWQSILEEFPVISDYGIEVGRGDPSNAGGRKVEFYPPDEGMNPRPGTPYIEVFSEDLTRGQLMGDALHYAQSIDPTYQEFREKFRGSLTDEQKEQSHRRYERYTNPQKGDPWPAEKRSYKDWFEASDLHQIMGGLYTGEWGPQGYTEQQKKLTSEMMGYFRGQ